MKKKNSIILMIIVLITMFVNVNSVMAKLKTTCYYKLSEVNGRENTLEISLDKDKKKITVNGYTNCLMNLSNKDKKNTKKITACLKKKGSYNFDYDSSCASGSTKYGASKTLKNVKGCPKNLCVKSKTSSENKNKETTENKNKETTENKNKETTENKNEKTSENVLDCDYKVTDIYYADRKHGITPTVDTKKKKIYLTERDNCRLYLRGTTDSKKYERCDKKKNTKKSFEYDYDPECMNFDPNFMFRPYSVNGTVYNSDKCPKQLCVKPNDKNKDKDATKDEKNLCWYDVNGNKDFNMVVPTNGKKTKFTVAASVSCELELKKDATDKDRKACANKKGEFVSYDFDPSCEGAGFKKYNIVSGNANASGCPKQLCLRKSNSVRPLGFSNKKGCAMWGSLLAILKQLLNYAKIFMGIGLIILTMVDFSKAVAGSNPEEALSKSKKKLTTRIIIFLILLLAPEILNVLIKYVLNVESCVN